MFDLFQTAHLGKLPRDIMTIIRHYYDYKKFLIMYYNDDEGVRECLIRADCRRNAIRQLISGISKNESEADIFLNTLADNYHDFCEDYDTEDKILLKFVQKICDANIQESQKFIIDNFDMFVDVVETYNHPRNFKVIIIEN